MLEVTPEMAASIIESIIEKRGDVLEREQIEIAVQDALEGKEPPDLEDERGAPFDWIETIKLIFETVGFIKTCVEFYAAYNDILEARLKAKGDAEKRGLSDEVSDVVCDIVEKRLLE